MAFSGTWTLFYSWGCSGSYGSTSMTVNSDGTWSNGEGFTGVWAEEAGMVVFKFDNILTTYAGNIAGLSVTGINTTFAGLNGCFYMLERSARAAFAEARAEGQPDASGGGSNQR